MGQRARQDAPCLADLPTCVEKVNVPKQPPPPYYHIAPLLRAMALTHRTAREKGLCNFRKRWKED